MDTARWTPDAATDQLLPWLLHLPEEERKRRLLTLVEYLEILTKWNGVYNLVGPREIPRLITHHVLPSLALASRLPEGIRVLDVGSGAGFPGLMVALVSLGRHVTLAERNGKKARFLEHVIRRLRLERTVVFEGDVRALTAGPYDAITARAWGPLPALLRLTRPLAHRSTAWYLLKGPQGIQEARSLPTGWRADWSILERGERCAGPATYLLRVVRSSFPTETEPRV